MNKYSNKLFTTPEQTSKLIEIGLPKPKSIDNVVASRGIYFSRKAYSVGEILSFLPPYLGNWQLLMHFNTHYYYWSAYYLSDGSTDDKYLRLNAHGGQLIDALFRLAIMLKEDGLI